MFNWIQYHSLSNKWLLCKNILVLSNKQFPAANVSARRFQSYIRRVEHIGLRCETLSHRGVYTTLLITHPLYPIQKMLRCIFLKGQAGLYQYCNNDKIQSNIHQITEYTSGSTKVDSILLFFLLLFKFCQAQRSWLVLISVYYHPPTNHPEQFECFNLSLNI